MTTVNFEYAQLHLAELLDIAASGESVVIEYQGEPKATLTSLDLPDTPDNSPKPLRRVGFLDGKYHVPDNWKEIGRDEIIALFEGEGGV